MWRDRGLVRDMLARAAAAGYEAIVITVDVAVLGRRERDVRRGFTLPPKIGLGTLVDGAVHPGWTWDFVRAEPITFANVAGGRRRPRHRGGQAWPTTSTPSSTRRCRGDDLDWFRSVWDGPIMVKGMQTVADAVLAADAGVEAVALSNHGGRQLDGAPTPIELVQPVVDAVGDRTRDDLRRRRPPGQRHRQGRRPGRHRLHGGTGLPVRSGRGRRTGRRPRPQLARGRMCRTMALTGCRTITDLGPDLVAWRSN